MTSEGERKRKREKGKGLSYAVPFSSIILMRVTVVIKRIAALGFGSHSCSPRKTWPKHDLWWLDCLRRRAKRSRGSLETSIKTYRSSLLLLVMFVNAENCFALVGLNSFHLSRRFSPSYNYFFFVVVWKNILICHIFEATMLATFSESERCSIITNNKPAFPFVIIYSIFFHEFSKKPFLLLTLEKRQP